MKKMLMAVVLMMFGVLIPALSLAATNGIVDRISGDFWDTQPDSYWFNQQCYETKTGEIYSGTAGIFVDAFRNTTNKDLYILDAKVLTRGDYLKYNNTKYHNTDYNYNTKGLVILNENLYNSDYDMKVKKGQTVIHMTTAEKIPGATRDDYSLGWKFSNPHTLFGTVFNYANYAPNGTHPESATRFPNWDAEFRVVTVYSDDERFSTSDDNHAIVECQRIVVRRCGDGILDEEHEECDPNHPDWNEETCNPDTCKKQPVCNSKFNGGNLVNLEEGPELCTVGTVKNFKYDEATRTWTWECEAAGTGTQCSAKKTYNGTWEIEKTLVSESKYVTQTGQELVWEIKVTAIGGDVKDMKIKDYLPKVLSYVSYTKNLPAGVTMVNNNQPTKGTDSTGDYLQWQTVGTLKENESIVLKVTTKVNTMPKVTDNYKNVACASPEGEQDKCDDEPVKTEGRLEIEKTLTGKVTVQKTGEILTWNVKVTALSGDVDGFEIQDIVPFALQYVDYSVASNPDNLTVKDPTGHEKTSTGNVYTWDASGVLQSGHSLLLTVKTKVILMPKAEDDYRNVACVFKEGNKEDCDDDKPGNPNLRIKKYILDGNNEVKTKNVKIGDEITYRVYFGNSGNAEATITSIKDFLPKNVKYKSSTIYIERNSSHSSGTQVGNEEFKGYKIVDGVYIDIYGGLTLQPEDRGYIEIKAEVLSDNQDNRTNFACIYLNNEVVDCDDATHNLPGEVMCESNIRGGSKNICDGSNRTVPVSCNSTGGVANEIQILCDDKIQYSGNNISTLTGNCVFGSSKGSHTVKCKVNKSTIAITGSSCEGTYTVTNNCDVPPRPCFPAGTKVIMSDGTTKNIENIEEGDVVLSYNTDTNINEPNVVTKKLVHEDSIHEMYELTINETVLKVTDVHRFYVRKSESSNDYSWIEAQNLKVGDILLMNDGSLAKIEKINHYLNKQTVYNFEVENNHNYFVDKGYLVHNSKGGEDYAICKRKYKDNGYVACESTDNRAHFKLECGNEIYYYDDSREWKHTFKECKNYEDAICYVKGKDDNNWKTSRECGNDNHKDDTDDTPFCKEHPNNPICELANPHCFNVNEGNFSIELGEYLPFYFNVKRPPAGSDHKFIFDNAEEGDSCGDLGAVDLGSLKCRYVVRKPQLHRSLEGDDIVYSLEGINCLSLDDREKIENESLIGKWLEKQKELYGIDKDDLYRNYWPTIKVTKSDEWTESKNWESDKLGEYEFQIEVYEYYQCEEKGDGSLKWTEETIDGPDIGVCQSNFVLTEPYTVQKTPSGNVKASTTTLEKFKQVDGDSIGGLKSFASYLKAIATSQYHPNETVNKAMDAFINKYKKLAVNVDLSNSKFLSSTVEVRKVPGKHIYFVDGDITVKGGSNNIKTPFTIVQTSGKTTIKGNVNHNMMLLTNGSIVFEGSCTENQNVKGIFYAKNGLERKGVGKNTSLDNKEWCTKGGLNVKGVLIGNNFNELMKDSRSHLDTWFQRDGSRSTSDAQELRGKIMNGASVVIEYSPSIFTKSTMPPGAEDFTTALSIYKN